MSLRLSRRSQIHKEQKETSAQRNYNRIKAQRHEEQCNITPKLPSCIPFLQFCSTQKTVFKSTTTKASSLILRTIPSNVVICCYGHISWLWTVLSCQIGIFISPPWQLVFEVEISPKENNLKPVYANFLKDGASQVASPRNPAKRTREFTQKYKLKRGNKEGAFCDFGLSDLAVFLHVP